jgi:hypothetical protein
VRRRSNNEGHGHKKTDYYERNDGNDAGVSGIALDWRAIGFFLSLGEETLVMLVIPDSVTVMRITGTGKYPNCKHCP